MEKKSLHLDYEINFADYREYFFEEYKKSLPRMFAFWGTAFILSVVIMVLMKFEPFFALVALTMAAIPTTTFVMSYQSFTRQTKTAYKNLTGDEKKIYFNFQEDSEGFDCIRGKNFSHISWDSISDISEREKYFLFKRFGSSFLIPKSAFRSVEERRFFEWLVDTNVKNRIAAN